jgi:P-type Mg2+ transporter
MNLHEAASNAWWSLDIEALLAQLDARCEGLSDRQATERLQSRGPNRIEAADERTAAALLIHQFASPLVLVLVLGASVSLLLRDWGDAAIILVIVLGSTLLGFAQEYRASSAMAQLRRRLALTVRVRREHRTVVIQASEIVPGDIVELSAGNRVPADGRVLSARDFLVTAASLTGESFPVEKSPAVSAQAAPLAQRTGCVWMGTSVRSGTASVLVVSTGRDTAFGHVARQLRGPPPEPSFARGVRRFGYLLLRLMVVIVLLVLLVNAALGRTTIESLMFAVALAVGLSPGLLPAIVSVTLALGARAMAGRGVIVRRLDAIEDLGSMSVLCTDKTGTLTEGRMTLQAATDPQGAQSARTLELAWLNASLQTGIDNPLDAAIVQAVEAIAPDSPLRSLHPVKVDEVPYDFERRRLTVVVQADVGTTGISSMPSIATEPGAPGTPCTAVYHRAITKGAVDEVLGCCQWIRVAQGAAGPVAERTSEGAESAHAQPIAPYPDREPITDEHRRRLQAIFAEQGRQGFRVLAVASRDAPARASYGRLDETDMTFEGFLSFTDPPKVQAAQALCDLAALNVRVKMVTGDNRHVAQHLAAAVGLDPQAFLTGEAIASLSHEALAARAARTDLFVEVDPQQKELIVRALQKSGHAVGFLGDGINDAPALHAADVGISVDGAVDVARESADVVLLAPDLDVLRQGVEGGRRTFANTLKYIRMAVSANFGNMVSMALATPFLPFLPMAAK